MKIKMIDLATAGSGKVCEHSDFYFETRKRRKGLPAVFTGRMCNPYDGGDSAAQQTAREKFATVSAAVTAIMADPTALAPYKAAFEKQYKYNTLRGYVFAEEYKKL